LMDVADCLSYRRHNSGPFVVYGLDRLEAKLNLHFCRRTFGVSRIRLPLEYGSEVTRICISYMLHMMYWYDNVIEIVNHRRVWKMPRSIIDAHGYMNPVPA